MNIKRLVIRRVVQHHERLAERVGHTQFIKDVRIVAGQISNDDPCIENRADDPSGDAARSRVLVRAAILMPLPLWRRPTGRARRPAALSLGPA